MLFLTVAALFAHYTNIRSGIPNHGSDFEQDHALARSAMRGENPYFFLHSADFRDQSKAVRVNHPPGAGIILSPLSWLSLDDAYVTFCAISLAVFLFSLALLGSELLLPPTSRIALVIIGLSWWPTIFAVRMGSLSLLIAALLISGWVFAQRGQRCLSGALIAIAVHLKIFPLLLPIQFLLTRAWRQFFWTVMWIAIIGLLTTAVMGTQVWIDFAHVADLYREHAAGVVFNISLYGLGEQLFGKPNYLLKPVIDLPNKAPLFGIIGSAAILGLTIVHWVRKSSSPNNYMLSLCAMILISPASWTHTIAILALPLTVGVLCPHKSFWPMVAVVALVSFPDLTFVRFVENVIQATPPWNVTIGIALRLPTLGVILLFWLLFRDADSEKQLPERSVEQKQRIKCLRLKPAIRNRRM